jgi:hypothetical protein
VQKPSAFFVQLDKRVRCAVWNTDRESGGIAETWEQNQGPNGKKACKNCGGKLNGGRFLRGQSKMLG